MEKTVRMIFKNVMFDTIFKIDGNRTDLRERVKRFAGSLGAAADPEAWQDLEVFESDGLLTLTCRAVALDTDLVDRDARCALFSLQREVQASFAPAGPAFPWQPAPVRSAGPAPPDEAALFSESVADPGEAGFAGEDDVDAPFISEIGLEIDLELVDEYGGPLAGWTWRLDTNDESLQGVTGRDGRLSGALAGPGRLYLFAPGDPLPARVFELHLCPEVPPQSLAAAQLDLNRLGFFDGKPTGLPDAATAAAILAFQHYVGHADPSGALDESTRTLLTALCEEP